MVSWPAQAAFMGDCGGGGTIALVTWRLLVRKGHDRELS